jgi:hypothetical protein
MKWLGLVGVAALVVSLSGTATAGDYHTGLNNKCTDCHIMHYSRSHDYNPPDARPVLGFGAGGPYHFLLRDEINPLCLACHDASGSGPDVLGADTGKYAGIVRNGGYLNSVDPAVGAIGNPVTGHTLGSTDVAPGGTWNNATGMNCTDCHHQHGYGGYGNPSPRGNFRNLQGFAFVTYNSGAGADNTYDVRQTGTFQYDESGSQWNEPDQTRSAIADWCANCHTNFHGALGGTEVGGDNTSGDWEEFVRHPSAGVDIGAIGGGHSSITIYDGTLNKVKVMGDWELGPFEPGGTPTTATATCISCHKAHGNGNAFGMILRSRTLGNITEDGDDSGTSRYENLCSQCHTQAGAYS